MIGDPVALVVRRHVERASRDLVERFAGAQTSFIADAQQGFRCLHHAIKPIAPGMRFAGTAVSHASLKAEKWARHTSVMRPRSSR